MKAITMLVLSVLMTVPSAPSAAVPREDFKPVFDAVRALVEKHYPKAVVTAKDSELHFEFNTRKFMIHEALMTGEWQDAREEIGPQKGGVFGDIAVVSGPYEGQALLPQDFDKRYFVVWAAAPYSKKLDRHLLVHLKYSRNAPNDFRKEFAALVEKFETLVR